MRPAIVPRVTIIDPLDREIEGLLASCGIPAARLVAAEMMALGHPAAQMPDVLVVDLRGGRPIPAALAAVKRQHPDVGVLVVASIQDPALLLEAMRAGAGEFLAEPGVDGALIGGASLKPDEMAGIAARAGITAQARGLAS